MSHDASRTEAPPRYLSTLDAVAVIVGVVIGSGIFETTPGIAKAAGTPALFLAIWVFGGLAAMAGALCFAELGVLYPEEGGVYAFFRRGLGRRIAVYYGFCDLSVIHPATIGMMAFVHARFAVEWAPIPGVSDPDLARSLHAAFAVIALATLNLLNLRGGSRTQNVLSLAKVVGLALAFLAGCVVAFSGEGTGAGSVATMPVVPDVSSDVSVDLGLAALFVLFTYGGWNDLVFVAGEIRDPRRKLRRAMVLGVLSVTAIYLLLNLSFLAAIGIDGVAASDNVVEDVVAPAFGAWGAKAVGMLVSLCALGALNACIFTGSRVYVALGQDVPALSFLRRWSAGTPRVALVTQALTALAMISMLRSDSAFRTLLIFSTPFFWSFMALVGVVYFAAIFRDLADRQNRPTQLLVRILLGIAYVASAVYLVYCSLTYAWSQDPQVTFPGVEVSIMGVQTVIGRVQVSVILLVSMGLACLLAMLAVALADRRPIEKRVDDER